MDPEPAPPPRLTLGRLLWRGLTRRCPLCGAGKLFRRWFWICERCPRCNFPMERIEGHWLGALGMNSIVCMTALFASVVIGFAVTRPHNAVGPLIAVGITVSVVVPVLFYPFSKTLWSAIDLAMRPLEPDDDIDPRWIPPGKSGEDSPSPDAPSP